MVTLNQSQKTRTRSYFAFNPPTHPGAFLFFAPWESSRCATLMRPPRHAISSAVLPPPLVFGDTPLSTRAFASASLPSTAAIIRKFWPWSPGSASGSVDESQKRRHWQCNTALLPLSVSHFFEDGIDHEYTKSVKHATRRYHQNVQKPSVVSGGRNLSIKSAGW